MSGVTVAALDELCQKYREKEQVIEALEAQITPINKELAAMRMQMAQHLAELGREDYSSPVGKIKKVENWSVKNPVGEENKNKLWQWMRDKGIYDAYATVHATALKTLFMKEREIALANGEDPLTWALPGMEPAKLFEDVKLTKK